VFGRSVSFVLSQGLFFLLAFLPIKSACHHPPRLACNLSGLQFDPTISPIKTSTTITSSNSPFAGGSGVPNQLPDDLLLTTDVYELPRVRTELQNLLVVPSLAPHPEQAHAQSARHRYFGDALFPAHGQM